MSGQFPELEHRYVVVKIKDLNKKQNSGLMKHMQDASVPVREAVVVEKDNPGFDVACGIAIHGRICRRLSACTCVTQEQRDPCFDWVKV
jgi:hypothetical protein